MKFKIESVFRKTQRKYQHQEIRLRLTPFVPTLQESAFLSYHLFEAGFVKKYNPLSLEEPGFPLNESRKLTDGPTSLQEERVNISICSRYRKLRLNIQSNQILEHL
ncbi:uncharacterized protein LOC143242846 isoform X3 [Tachypleus tridentatus]|uniref:uncharacterized protein LOC143242846 isoform X3 n=1 Tax=Tachypleus tridentatus TaxID=6853 RepID=UPI003FD212CF